ncbi:MAG TPA: carbohydrate binding domain-containing protein [Candidatus Sulfotelmatobacter sp.]|jgi:tetratricopeptide (TPR) repeat protein|nr:carbohydrate binding domain-containing protein [Candidatus Sulfotelmatobacter sp.]
MVLRLSSRATRGLLLAASGVFLFLAYFSIRAARAAHAIGLNTREGYEQAVRLEPGDARNWYLLGRFFQYDFDQPDPAAALHAFMVSRSLDPFSADTLLDLATNYEDAGKIKDARAAYLQAKQVYPLSAEVLWRYGNFLLRQNELAPAFSEIHRAVELDPKRGAEAFFRCYRVVPDVNEILDDVIPPNLQTHLDIISDLTNDNQLDVALLVWSRANILPGTLNLLFVTSLANALIQNNRAEEVALLWRQATGKLAAPIPPDPPRSVLWDGGFESGFSLGGLGWHFSPVIKGVLVALDTQEKHSGNQSLELMFAGRSNVSFSDVCHWAAVEPGRSYQFSSWIRTKALTTEQGVRFTLYANTQGNWTGVPTAEIHGDQPWTNVTLAWTAPTDVALVNVCVSRFQSGMADHDIAGIAWVDDVSLVPAGAEPKGR